MALAELLDEYDQNKVRANTQLRYQQNGKREVATSGFISRIEELYSVLTPTQEGYSAQELRCYYANTEAALHITKGESVSVIGRIRGVGEYSGVLHMYACKLKGLELESYPKVSIRSLRENVVQVFCVQEASVFGVVRLSSENRGTGVIIDAEEGTILTVHHVVADENDCKRVEISLPGSAQRIPVAIRKHCASIDRARLQVSPRVFGSRPIEAIYRSSAPAQIDEEVHFWGYGPGALRMETGLVQEAWGDNFVIDAYAVLGDSGSPVFDENGHLLGTISRGNRSDRTVFTGDEC
ncbi:MAG: serine protease [Chloroflexi bacterium]|nr:serine protease [Chloroflexota bacterium]